MATTSDTRQVHWADWARIALFALFLVLPALRASLDGWTPSHPEARREPAPWPGTWSPPAFEDWFDDRLGFRGSLVRAHAFVKVFGLRTSPDAQVRLGRDGWLFFDGGSKLDQADRVVHQARGTRRLSEVERAVLLHGFVERRDMLAKLDVPYLLVFAPNKPTIYGEKLRPPAAPAAETPLDQVLRDLSGAGVRALDLRPALRAAKSQGLVYYRTNSHWNALGAEVAAREILRALERPLPAAPRAVAWEREPGSNLAAMLALAPSFREEVPVLEHAAPRRAVRRPDAEVLGSDYFRRRPKLREEFETRGLVFTVYEVADPSLPTAVVLVDSFGAWLMEPLSEHFRTTTWLHRQTPQGLVRRVVRDLSPDFVIEERVERSLVHE
ncbi:MAG: alginate O-acetyltransferase AlgX-related protein [Myxococcota bacterium]